jgi:hypothetical protein
MTNHMLFLTYFMYGARRAATFNEMQLVGLCFIFLCCNRSGIGIVISRLIVYYLQIASNANLIVWNFPSYIFIGRFFYDRKSSTKVDNGKFPVITKCKGKDAFNYQLLGKLQSSSKNVILGILSLLHPHLFHYCFMPKCPKTCVFVKEAMTHDESQIV